VRRYSSATLPPRAVGLIADQAKRAGYRIRVIDVGPGQAVPDAGLYADGYTGRARRVVDDDRGYLLGVTFVGPGTEELIHSATIAVAGQVPVSRFWHAVPWFLPSAKCGCACSRPTGT
jgi:pyruvate/2-oxoglutarate dehydrogenase complex dihydrolipoamide dehydrogenase (E3) component